MFYNTTCYCSRSYELQFWNIPLGAFSKLRFDVSLNPTESSSLPGTATLPEKTREKAGKRCPLCAKHRRDVRKIRKERVSIAKFLKLANMPT